MDREQLIANIERFAAIKGERATPACIAAGVGKTFLSDIKRGQTPSVAKIADLAEYLGCCTSDLVGDLEQRQPSELSALWDQLDDVDRAQLVGFARGLAAAEKYIKTARSADQTAG